MPRIFSDSNKQKMDFETFKKNNLATSGDCPKCEKHFARLRTHANACLKNDYLNFLLTNRTGTIQAENTETNASTNNLEENTETNASNNNLAKNTETNASNNNLAKNTETNASNNNLAENDPVSGNKKNPIVERLKVVHSNNQSKENDEKEKCFQAIYEKIIESLKKSYINGNPVSQYRFDFSKMSLDVKMRDEKNNGCTANEIHSFQNTMPIKLIQKGPSSSTPTPVVLVTNLNPNKVSLDHLFILFGVYGDVIRIKMFEKKLCYIEFLETEHSERAIKYLNNCELWEKQIKVSACIYHSLSDSSPDKKCDYREYINSPLHRHKYRKPGLPNYIYAPSSTLHLSNMPSNMREDDLKYLFESYGRIKSIRFLPISPKADKSRANIEMSTVHEGIMALINNHGKKLDRNMHLRCNFHGRNY